ncbi:MAG: hypothetical protein AABZ08_09640 [Planctomycetota bacterium]
MCGIFGIITSHAGNHPTGWIEHTVARLFTLSESRGKEAAGIAAMTADAIRIYKEDTRATEMIRHPRYRGLLRDTLRHGGANGNGRSGERHPLAIIGHSRLVTTGGQDVHLNNQPVIAENLVGIHNGIIVNHDELWRRYPSMTRRSDVDSEVILGLTRHFLSQGRSLMQAVRETFALIQGAASVALLFGELNHVVLATNNGSLYLCQSESARTLLFASEMYILQILLSERTVRNALGDGEILHVCAGDACLVNLADASMTYFALAGSPGADDESSQPHEARKLIEILPEANGHGVTKKSSLVSTRNEAPACGVGVSLGDLRRCTRCILPETMPFIEFDASGVCNYCHKYKKLAYHGVAALEKIVAPFRRTDGRPECLVGMSGGRDSCHVLHIVKCVLKLNPIAYTYDWGMVTDLARRNISRMCGKLGVEHILVSADIAQKRRNIRKNVLAWLRRPDLGMIPLFMAGDKQYFYHANRLKKQLGVPLTLLGENMLERTDFKSGFSNIRPAQVSDDHAYALSLTNKAKILQYYGGQYLRNPAYLNVSLADTMFAYACYYFVKRDFLNLYRYVEWKEEEIVATLRGEYDWELADDTTTTWRIGDGTASFYNYIYMTVAGFCENDTFRSNQIREGILTRAEALAHITEENKPRWKSIRWYCDIIGVDFEYAISTINRTPKLRAMSRDGEGTDVP